MTVGDTTIVYDGVLSGAAIKTAIDTTHKVSGGNFVTIPNINSNAVLIMHVEGGE